MEVVVYLIKAADVKISNSIHMIGWQIYLAILMNKILWKFSSRILEKGSIKTVIKTAKRRAYGGKNL